MCHIFVAIVANEAAPVAIPLLQSSAEASFPPAKSSPKAPACTAAQGLCWTVHCYHPPLLVICWTNSETASASVKLGHHLLQLQPSEQARLGCPQRPPVRSCPAPRLLSPASAGRPHVGSASPRWRRAHAMRHPSRSLPSTHFQGGVSGSYKATSVQPDHIRHQPYTLFAMSMTTQQASCIQVVMLHTRQT